ncbi:undecaprenyl diphosphate synthase family protein [Ruegeria sp. HKCCA0235A]|uniref:undecaprenyl diphosphate synthase family protein n=1 Tax=Ruegeria sp. HKCCA0235A TaxID=2682998 RepID=UPI0014877D8D|nr:undecaprenyl diphosphate synthase family protein [Ruegeria sp. HKCCA0235A]
MANYKVRHLGLIPDGAGRWASARGETLVFGYQVSVRLIEQLVKEFFRHGGSELSIYLFAVANFKRQDWEIDALMKVADEFMHTLSENQAYLGVSVTVAGDRSMLPNSINSTISTLENRNTYKHTLNLLLAYDPVQEIQAALETEKVEKVEKGEKGEKGDDLLEHLWVKNPVDLVVRTGGAKTLSKFLPMQSSHARLIFLDELLNDLEVSDLMRHVYEHEAMDLQYGE